MKKKYKLTKSNDSFTSVEKFEKLVEQIKNEKPELFDKMEDILKDYGKFINDTAGEDELQSILRAHLYIEQELIQLLSIYLKEPDVFLKSRVMFANKLNLTIALGLLPKEVKPAYDKLNQIRNSYAHNLGYQCTDQDIYDIIQHFHGELKMFFEMLLSKKEEVNIRNILALMWIKLRFDVKRLPLTLKLHDNRLNIATLREEREEKEKYLNQ